MSSAPRLLGVAAAFGLLAQLLFFGQLPGLNVLVATAAVLGILLAQRRPGAALDPRDLWIPIAALVFAAFCAVRADVMLLVFDVPAALGLALASAAPLAGTRVMALPAGGLLAETAALAGSALGRGAAVVAAAWPVLTSPLGSRARRATGYAGGVVLALPFLIVFSALFASADAVFARSIADAFDLRRWLERLGELPGRAALAAVAAWLVAGTATHLARPPRLPAGGGGPGVLASDAATAMLGAIDLLFLAFVGLQAAYLFGGRDTIEAAQITYSAYARRGFFELIAAAAIVGVLVFVLELGARAPSRAYRGAALTLVALCGAVLVSATYRLDLYQQAYGWTELRVYALAMIAFLAGALAVLAYGVARARMRWTGQPLAIAALAVAAGVNAVGPSGLVARENIARWSDPSLLPADAVRGLDAYYLAHAGDGAIPPLVEILPLLPEDDRANVTRALRYALQRHDALPSGWQSWNAERERARAALERLR